MNLIVEHLRVGGAYHRRRRPRPGRGIAAVGLAVLVAACTAAPSPTPTAEPTPSPTSVDIAERFSATMLDPNLTGTAEVEGSLSVGAQTGTISGSAEFAGEASHQAITVSLAQTTVETEQLSVLGKNYSRTANGPWLLGEDGDGGATFQSQIADLLVDLRDEGIEEVDGAPLHHLLPTTAVELGAEMFGIDASTVANLLGDVDFYARPDGTPAIVSFSLTWTQAESPAEMEIRFTLDLDSTPTIQPPDEVWITFDSDRYDYTMAHPEPWATEELDEEGQAFDVFYLSGSSEVQVHHYADIAGATATEWFDDMAAAMSEGFGAEVEVSEPFTIDGVESRYFALHFTDDGTDLFHQEAVLFAGSQAWELWWFSASGTEARDRDTFELFASTFHRGMTPTAAGNVWTLAPGDCFGSLPFGLGGGNSAGFIGGVDGFQVVDCGEPHTGEVIAVLAEVSLETCEATFEEYVGRAVDGSVFDLFTMTPVAADNAPAGVGSVCMVGHGSGSSTGSAAGTAR